MTSFAFICGLIPLVFASGAGAATQQAVATAVFGGMIAASFLGIFVIPGLYVLLQSMREWVKGTKAKDAPAAASDADVTILLEPRYAEGEIQGRAGGEEAGEQNEGRRLNRR